MSVPERPPVEAGGRPCPLRREGFVLCRSARGDRHTRGLNIFKFFFCFFSFYSLSLSLPSSRSTKGSQYLYGSYMGSSLPPSLGSPAGANAVHPPLGSPAGALHERDSNSMSDRFGFRMRIGQCLCRYLQLRTHILELFVHAFLQA